MKVKSVPTLLLSIGVVVALAGCDPHGWREIRVEASYSEDGGLSIDEELHDVGVSGPGDTVSWVLDCRTCPSGTQYRITELKKVADLDPLTTMVVTMFENRERGLLATLGAEDLLPVNAAAPEPEPAEGAEQAPAEEEQRATAEREAMAAIDRELAERLRSSFGILEQEAEMRAARAVFELVEPGWQEWAELGRSISARSTRPRGTSADELWKYSIEIRVPNWEDTDDPSIPDELERCQQNPRRACWDPHKYWHGDT